MKTTLMNYIVEELLSGRRREEIDENHDLLLSGTLDSLGAMQLVFFIEQEFGLEVPPEDVTIENFRSVASIAEYLAHKLATR